MTAPTAQITFITGGARSGKSAYAVRVAKQATGEVCYLATAEPIDDEMRERIAAHKAERPDSWLTIEEPLSLDDVLNREAPASSSTVLPSGWAT